MMRGWAGLWAAVGARYSALARLATLLLVIFFLVFFIAPASPLRAAALSGNYDGIGDAAHMVLTLQQAERRIVGRLTMSGAAYTINGERAEADSGGAQGVLRFPGETADSDAAFFHLEERPLGLQFLFIPAKGDGTPDLAHSQEFSFLKRGIRPTVSADNEPRYRLAPENADILVFLDEFRGWAPRETARLYAALDDRTRGLLLLYDHATAELMWRLCEAAPAEGSREASRLAEMQERQQTDCAAYLPHVEAARKGGLFSEFLRRSLFQLELIRATVLCTRGETARARCADVSALGAPLILRWRRADAIMADLARPGRDALEEEMREGVVSATEAAPEKAVVEELRTEDPAALSGNAAPHTPLPLRRPVAESDAVSDFAPDTAPLTAEAVRMHRLPLARPD